ncbi:MAG: ATP-binding protein, partial [Lachnospiraceae bacterium]|nr:ATP-binding protein [Lachnospiraceae bacterium]
RKYYPEVAGGTVEAVALSGAFDALARMLCQHHGMEVIIMIDEYDIPIQQGHTHGFYDEVIDFMRNLFSGGLKDNRHLAYGFLTGILRVAKESIFSGLNNLVIHSVIDDKYSRYFGFTRDEVEKMATYYHAEDKMNELVEWYDGYRFGDTEIFNPWSVINYFSIGCKPRAFWQATGSNEIISEVIAGADEEIYERLEKLLRGEKFTTLIDTGVIYPQIQKNPSTIYSFLLVAGYLKAENVDISQSGDFIGEVSLPNKEIKAVYNKEILQKLDGIVSQSSAVSIQEAVYANDVTRLEKSVEKLLRQSASSFDTAGEMFFHGLFLGICALFDNRYYLTSNRESGKGRFDIRLMPRDNSRPGILIELKSERDVTEEQLEALAQSALDQINNREYDTEMKTRGVKTIFKYGVAFSGKNVKIVK